jgi:methyl-accepting chemotaxis protein
MIDSSKSNFFASLKGKIMSVFGGLALFLGLLIFAAYFLISFIGNFVIVLVAVVAVASVVAVGWWLAKQIAEPIEKVSLVAKSLERGVSTSIPKDSGSLETDDLLATLGRLNQQTQKLLNQIDEISNGKLKGISKPSVTSDRLGNSLYNLVTKISNSIKAEKDFSNLKNSLRCLYEDFSAVKRGDLSTDFRQTSDETENIAVALNFLLKELKDVVKDVQSVASQSRSSALQIQESVHNVAQTTESKAKEIVWVSDSLKHIPDTLQRIENEISTSNTSIIISLENAYNSLQATQESSVLTNRLRQQVQESTGRIQKLTERSQDIEKVAKLVEDLAHRTNMVAMNASIQATAAGEAGRGFIVVAEEVEKLAQRASNTNKQISSLNKSIAAEINELSSSLDSSSRDTVGISRLTQQIGTALTEVEKHLSSNTERQQKLLAYTQLQSQTSQKSFVTFKDSILEIQGGLDNLHKSEKHASQIVSAMQSLDMAVSAFKLINNTEDTASIPNQDFTENETTTPHLNENYDYESLPIEF